MQYITVEVASQKSLEIAKAAYEKFIKEVPECLKMRNNGIPTFPKIVWKKKGYKLAGTAKAWCNLIEMNINFLSSPSYEEFIKSTVIHELAHIINRYYYGRNHDNQWKMIDRLLGNSGERCHNYRTPENKINNRTYHLVCPDCGHVYNVTKYRYDRYYNYICRFCRVRLSQQSSAVENELKKLFEDI